jgi:predicted phosphodiesterase
MKILAIGDIHTKTWIIDLVESVIENYDAVVFVGDYADDFNTPAVRSLETWKKLMAFQNKYGDRVHLLKGNHDFLYVNKTPTLQSGYDYLTQTLIDAPENKKLKNWLKNLPEIEKVDGVTYSHAGITNGWLRSEEEDVVKSFWRDNSPIWIRPKYKNDYKKTPQVFGHTPSETCWEVETNIWCIDTFSTYTDNTPYGDGSMLEVLNGQKFQKIKINADHRNSSSIEDKIP